MREGREIRTLSGGSGRAGLGAEAVASGLGWFSIGLGMVELGAGRALGRFIGVGDRPALMGVLGLREIASGVGILATGRAAPWLRARVAGDGLDIALLGSALGSRDAKKRRVLAALGAAAGVTAIDVWCSRRLDAAAGRPDAAAEWAITVSRPPEELFRIWRDLENAPLFMGHVRSVYPLDPGRSHWVAEAPGALRLELEWDAEITGEEPGRRIEWRSSEGAVGTHSGSVRFTPALGGRGTEVRLRIEGLAPGQMVQEDLRRFKRLAETGEIPTTRGQPSGPSRFAFVSRSVRRMEGKVA